MSRRTLIEVAIAVMIVVAIWHTHNEGVKTGYDAIAVPIGVTENEPVMVGDVKITSTGVYRKRPPKPAKRAWGACGNCHTEEGLNGG